MSHLSTIAAMPCILCDLLGTIQESRTECHHVREGQGMSQRAHDELAIPLCAECHRGPCGLHGDRSWFKVAKVDELDLLALTIRKFQGNAPRSPKPYKPSSKIVPRVTG